MPSTVPSGPTRAAAPQRHQARARAHVEHVVARPDARAASSSRRASGAEKRSLSRSKASAALVVAGGILARWSGASPRSRRAALRGDRDRLVARRPSSGQTCRSHADREGHAAVEVIQDVERDHPRREEEAALAREERVEVAGSRPRCRGAAPAAAEPGRPRRGGPAASARQRASAATSRQARSARRPAAASRRFRSSGSVPLAQDQLRPGHAAVPDVGLQRCPAASSA